MRTAQVLIALLSCIFIMTPPVACARGLRGQPPGLGMTVRELFGKWLRAAGGESAWKGLHDVSFDLTEEETLWGFGGPPVVRRVWIRIQPRLRKRVSFIDTDGVRRIEGLDSRGYYGYVENLARDSHRRFLHHPTVHSSPSLVEPVETYLKGLAFWLSIPFSLQLPQARLRFVGFLEAVRPGDSPLPMIEVDLTAVPDHPIDVLIVALCPDAWMPVEGRYRFADDSEAMYRVLFFDVARLRGVRYHRTRIFIDEQSGGELHTVMSRVESNLRIHESRFERPRWLERAP